MESSGTKTKIRVLVVDDSAFVRRSIIGIYRDSSEIEVIDVAGDGEEAVELTKRLRPDVVTLDVRMPVLDGIAALERIMRECPTPVVMFSSLTGKGGENTMRALELGAVDFIDKSSAGGSMDFLSLSRELTAKIQVAARVDPAKLKGAALRTATDARASLPASRRTDVVAIGTSTGGPPALQAVLGRIPATLACPVLIVQHMPKGFTASLAQRLDRHSPLAVREATDGEYLAAGHAYVAPAGWHMRLRRQAGNLQLLLDPEPDGSPHRPSVDALFESVAAVCGRHSLAVVLTGMGKDGSLGAQAIKKAGGRVVVESEETSIVFGMPKAVLETVDVDAVVPLYRVAETVLSMI